MRFESHGLEINKNKPVPRTKELLLRWAEYSTFTAVMRTHETNHPQENHQVSQSICNRKYFTWHTKIGLKFNCRVFKQFRLLYEILQE